MFGFPNCPGEEFEVCNDLRHLLTELAYLPNIQEHIVQAEVSTFVLGTSLLSVILWCTYT